MAWITHCDQCGKQEPVDKAFKHRHQTFFHVIPPSEDGGEEHDLDFCSIECLGAWVSYYKALEKLAEKAGK